MPYTIPNRLNTRKKLLDSLGHGATVKRACAAVGISRVTFYAWVNDDPVFRQAVEDAKDACCQSVYGALYRIATGHKEVVVTGKKGKGGDVIGSSAHEVYYPPSVPAINLLLTQIDPDFKPYNPSGPPGASDTETAAKMHELRQQYLAALHNATAIPPPPPDHIVDANKTIPPTPAEQPPKESKP